MEFLIMASAKLDWDEGDIIDVRPDGFAWASEELENPAFAIVRIPDAQVRTREDYLGALEHPNDPESLLGHCRWKIVGTDIIEKMATSTGAGRNDFVRADTPRETITRGPVETNRRTR